MKPKKSEYSSIIAEALRTSKGLSRLAAEMTAPLQQRRNYTGFAEKAFEIIPLCRVCHEPTSDNKIYDENFNQLAGFNSTDIEQQIHVCLKCSKDTEVQLRLVNTHDLSELPLYLNDPNMFIRKRAVDRLKEGV